MSNSLQSLIAGLIRPQLRELQAYSVLDPGDAIKLDAMENPYSWPDELKVLWLRELEEAALNRYPDPRADDVRAQLRENMRIADDFDLLLGNGSDEIIQMLIMALGGGERGVLAPEPSFVMYGMICTYTGQKYVGVDLQSDFDLDNEAMLKAIREHQPALVFIARPNNPTGNVFDERRVRDIIEASSGLVVVDEAYIPFTDTHALDLLREYENLLVMRTLSKLGLAGVRLGMLIGRPQWITEIDKIRLPYNINVLTQKTVQFALQHGAILERQAQQIRQDRAALHTELQALPQLQVWPSEANFLLFRLLQGSCADDVQQKLLASGVLVKNLHGKHRLLENCLRVTVGTAAENAAFIEALKAAV